MTQNQIKVLYIIQRFPHLTETFVAEEINALLKKEVAVEIVSLLSPMDMPIQSTSRKLLDITKYAHGLFSPVLYIAQVYFLFNTPGKYIRLLFELMKQPYPNQCFSIFFKRLLIFLKAVTIAYSCRQTGINLIHSHFAWLPGAAANICAELLNIPFSVTTHAYDIYSSNDLLRLVTAKASKIITISEFNRDNIHSSTGIPKSKISVIHCGINPKFTKNVGADRIKKQDSQPVMILSIGSLIAKKGHKFLIEASNILNEIGIEFSCTIIGGGPDQESLQNLIEYYKLQHRITLTGPLLSEEVKKAYLTHDIFVLASIVSRDGDMDGIPVVLMEAGQLGLPMISTNVSGIPEIVRNEETGLIVPPEDSAALAEAIIRFIKDPILRNELGNNARELVNSEFTIDRNVDLLMKEFLSIIESTK